MRRGEGGGTQKTVLKWQGSLDVTTTLVCTEYSTCKVTSWQAQYMYSYYVHVHVCTVPALAYMYSTCSCHCVCTCTCTYITMSTCTCTCTCMPYLALTISCAHTRAGNSSIAETLKGGTN